MNTKSKKIQVTQIHGHRGARGLLPENSLISFDKAIEIGCDALELDICVTKDDQLVVIHDPILNPDIVRDNNGNWISEDIYVRQLTLAELKEFDIGRITPDSAYAKRFARQQSVDSTRIPTLEEVIDLVREKQPSMLFNIELKSAGNNTDITPETEHYAKLVAEILSKHDLIDRAFVQSFDWRLPLMLQKKLPDLKIGLLSDQQSDAEPPIFASDDYTEMTAGLSIKDFPNIAHMVKKTGASVWSCNYKDLTPELMNDAIDLDLEVYVWTVNQPTALHEMLDFGVHAITTDYPDRLFKILEADI